MILYINSCVRHNSRTNKIAKALIDLIGKNDEIKEVKLSEENLLPLNEERLEYRTRLIEENNFDNRIFDYAKEFAKADTIVISAPFWDLSFPAILKTYFENIYVTGLVSVYDEKGQPKGLCKADKLYYVVTSGGPYVPDYSFDYVKSLAEDYLGIKETKLIKAEMLDVIGYDSKGIVEDTILNLKHIIKEKTTV